MYDVAGFLMLNLENGSLSVSGSSGSWEGEHLLLPTGGYTVLNKDRTHEAHRNNIETLRDFGVMVSNLSAVVLSTRAVNNARAPPAQVTVNLTAPIVHDNQH